MSTPETLLLLGHEAIDTLHHEAVLLLHLAQRANDNELEPLLDALYDHCEHHFATEEKLMSDCRYRGLDEHRHEHRRLLGEMEGMMRALERGRAPLVRSWLCERLPEWFKLHVGQLDTQMVGNIGVLGE